MDFGLSDPGIQYWIDRATELMAPYESWATVMLVLAAVGPVVRVVKTLFSGGGPTSGSAGAAGDSGSEGSYPE